MQAHFWKSIPQREMKWELQPDDCVVILVPKFRFSFLRRFVLPYLAKPLFRVRLDAMGSMFWKLADGTRTLEEIKTLMHQTFGEQLEPLEERFVKFVSQLQKGNLIQLYQPHNTRGELCHEF